MSFLEGVGNVVGRATQGISDAAQSISDAAQNAVQTINNAAQETRESIVNERRDNQIKKETKKQIAREKLADAARKCPQCGASIRGISAVCPSCGYEIRHTKTAESVSDLTKEIDKLEKKRNTVTDSIAKTLSGRANNSTDEKIASLIRNFVVPNRKEDIFEFMILAAGNIDAKIIAGKHSNNDVATIIIQAWHSKFEQTFQKAQFSFGGDSDFDKIKDIYYEKKQEIEDEKRNKGFSLFGRR